jgi:RNA polymerase sigma-70 factor (ECF subfamily)
MDTDHDEELLMASGHGDREAFSVLVERYYPVVLGFIGRYHGIRDAHAAEDLAQEVFLAAWKASVSFEPRAKVLTWLLRISANICFNYRRSCRLRTTVSLDGACAPDKKEEPPDVAAVAREQEGTIRAALADLPPHQRSALLLRHHHGLSYAEIADVLETSVPAVESLLFRARQTLRKVLEATGDKIKPSAVPRRASNRS